jgi:hypothetical protein
VRQQLQPFEAPGGEIFMRATASPVLVGVRAVVVGVEVRRLHHIDRAVDRLAHEVGVRVVPGDDRVEAVVEVEPRVHGMQPDAVAKLP